MKEALKSIHPSLVPTLAPVMGVNTSFYQQRFLVTGGAGFIGSHLVQHLLHHGGEVRVLDNLATGSAQNLHSIGASQCLSFGDTRDLDLCMELFADVDVVFHQAALGSVPRSMKDPLASHEVNVTGHLNILQAAKECEVKTLVYASSSSVYGDSPTLPKLESHQGKPLSPYAATKMANELYAAAFAKAYGMSLTGLRYFNVFGPRQNPQGPYAAVIPLFMDAVIKGESPIIFGDGSHSRDFTFVANVVRANILAAANPAAKGEARIFNVAAGHRTTLNQLFAGIAQAAQSGLVPKYGPDRPGDIPHSLADISAIEEVLGYQPGINVADGLALSYAWYAEHAGYFASEEE